MNVQKISKFISLSTIVFIVLPLFTYANSGSYTSINDSNDGSGIGNVNGSYARQATFFVPDRTWSITGATVPLFRASGNNSVDIYFRVETDNNGVPSDTLADPNAVAIIDSFTLGTYETKTVSFTPFELTSGVKYWVVLKTLETESFDQFYKNKMDCVSGFPSATFIYAGWDFGWFQARDFPMAFTLDYTYTPNATLPAIVDNANVAFADAMGFPWSDVVAWSGTNIKLVVGGGVMVFSSMLPWVIALVVIMIIVGFIYVGFRFFKH